MAKKDKVDLGKGFKRIFYVVAAGWGIFLLIYVLAEMSECLEPEKYVVPPFCEEITTAGALFQALLIWLGTTFVAYFFLKWIGRGFKK
jgi:hypothetical protein